MPSNLLLLLPLLGGYGFIHLFYFTRFRAQTLEGHRLIFEAAMWGFGFVLPARVLTSLLAPFAAILCNLVVASWLQSAVATREEEVPPSFKEFLAPAQL